MKEEDFKRLRQRVLSKAGLVNMSLRKKLSYEEALKINDITKEEFDLMGFEYNAELKQVQRVRYVSFDDVKLEDQSEEHEVKEVTEIQNIQENSLGVQLGDNFSQQNISQLQGVLNNYEIIMQMIEMFKSNKKIENKDDAIVVELPYEDDKSFKASYRVNKTINEQFKQFCKEHKEFTSKDLISMALKEYMEKHR